MNKFSWNRKLCFKDNFWYRVTASSFLDYRHIAYPPASKSLKKNHENVIDLYLRSVLACISGCSKTIKTPGCLCICKTDKVLQVTLERAKSCLPYMPKEHPALLLHFVLTISKLNWIRFFQCTETLLAQIRKARITILLYCFDNHFLWKSHLQKLMNGVWASTVTRRTRLELTSSDTLIRNQMVRQQNNNITNPNRESTI